MNGPVGEYAGNDAITAADLGWSRAPHAVTSTEQERVSLCELLDRVLYKGVVAQGELVISVADVDLVFLGLNLLLTSVERIEEMRARTRSAALANP